MGRQNILIVLIALMIYSLKFLDRKNDVGLIPRRLIIGVISARDHFSFRHAIRQSWGSMVQHVPDVELVFVLGERDCPIHPTDRLSSYTCQKWHINEEDESSEIQTFFKSKYVSLVNRFSDTECHIGIGFRILHPVIIEAVSVQPKLVKKVTNMQVILQDAKEVITSVPLTDAICSEDEYCTVKLAAPFFLPKGFEGELRVYRQGEDDVCLYDEDLFSLLPETKRVCEWANSSAIEYRFLRKRKDVIIKWRDSSCPIVSARFSLADKNALVSLRKKVPSRTEKWKNHLDNIQMKIEEEEKDNRDMLILPLLDVYSHLPQKVLAFLNWVTHERNSSYVMKVDDDTFVNIPMLDLLMKNEIGVVPTWWSHFHHHRFVPVYGKNAETDYPSLTYPTFPSGAGYLMTGSLARIVATTGPHLTAYGGEDVSMGIWVSSVADSVKTVDILCWLPHPACSQTVLIPQLSAAQIMAVWKKSNE